MAFEVVQLQTLFGPDNKSLSFQRTNAGGVDRSGSLSLGLVFEYASWNKLPPGYESSLIRMAEGLLEGLDCDTFLASVRVDYSDETLSHFSGDNRTEASQWPIPPSSLPAFSFVVLDSATLAPTDWQHVRSVQSSEITLSLGKAIFDHAVLGKLKTTMNRLVDGFNLDADSRGKGEALRIFIAGDRSSVGKSSVCLGIIGSLLKSGYSPSSLAYIKPATQSESTQLIQLYCEKHGIECVPIGPLVYYRGFTRAYLAGETETTEELLESAGRAVDRIARGKTIVLVDGVGFPAVGSICGTDNASVLKACSYRTGNDAQDRQPMGVVLVGGSGVGGAVDAFNLNATYFSQAEVPVLGAIFNKLALDGFYSLENCRKQVTTYFNQNEKQQRLGRKPFGFVPLFPAIAKEGAMNHVEEYIDMFGKHVDVASIVEAAHRVKASPSTLETNRSRPSKRQKVSSAPRATRNRVDIEMKAINAGAAPSA